MPLYKQKAIIKQAEGALEVQDIRFEDLEKGSHHEDPQDQVQPVIFENFDQSANDGSDFEADGRFLERKEPADEVEPIDAPSLNEIAKNLLARAEKEAEAIRQKAYEEGWKEGFEKGYREGLEELKERLKEVEKVILELSNLPSRVLNDYKRWLVDAAFKLAKNIIQAELSIHPQLFLDMLEKLLGQLDEASLITVYLNPEDLAALRIASDLEEWISLQDRVVKLKADPELPKGSCRVESEIELIDANLETCLEEVKRDLLARMRV